MSEEIQKMTREEARAAFTEEYTRRVGLSAEEFEDIEAWVEEIYSSDCTPKQCVDYIIERYDLTDLNTIKKEE